CGSHYADCFVFTLFVKRLLDIARKLHRVVRIAQPDAKVHVQKTDFVRALFINCETTTKGDRTQLLYFNQGCYITMLV
uniref:Uncharacterized protein n=1 Tax=Anopheles atroparvus TaxID=41427 RepID=A0AAG5DEE0_ANOAO